IGPIQQLHIEGIVSATRYKFFATSDNTQLGDTTIEGDTEESTENGDHGDEGVSYKRLLEECDKELLYKCEKTAKHMRWHDTGRTKDGKLRHPTDGLAWSGFNDRYSQSASDPRSVRFGLASDGFNPFGTMSTSHSTWIVLLIPYNLPPWICMK
ncbi:ribose 5-phosphate isomerase A, partial [Tanacetum coccineum]